MKRKVVIEFEIEPSCYESVKDKLIGCNKSIELDSDEGVLIIAHCILLGIQPYPSIDSCRPYIGDIIKASCGKIKDYHMSVYNEKNMEME